MTKYYSRSKGKFVDIATMPDQYVRNAFVKMCKHEPTEDVIFGEQQRERADNYKKLAEDNFVSSVADLDKIERLTKCNDKLQAMNDKLKDTTKEIIKEKDLAIFTLRSSLDHNISEYKQLTDTLRDKGMYEPYDKQGRVRDYQVEYSKVVKERDSYKKKANDMEMAKMNINRDLLDAKDKLKDTVSKCNNQLANAMPLESWKKINNQCEELQLENVRLVQQLEHDETVVSKRAYQIMFDECQKIAKDLDKSNDKARYLRRSLDSYIPKGDVKMFSEIPNTDDGWEFVSLLKKYLNNVSYKLRVRGQYLDDETKKTEGWQRYSYGQPIEKSKCLRVYVDINNKDVD